jgi:hypothetical protein
LTFDLQLTSLIRRGQELRDALAVEASHGTQAETRIWQRDCAAVVSQLSGGSKAHWLAREFSHAFLVRSTAGGVVEEASITDIVNRILSVLERAVIAVNSQQSSVDRQPSTTHVSRAAEAAPQVRRFEFVHDPELGPILEQAYLESRTALANGDFGRALVTSCSVLEAILTDALEHAHAGNVREWSFETRIAAAEQQGLIRGACARLPPTARTYSELADATGHLRPDVTISEREARLAGQVLQVVMRDLDPGR